MSAYEVLLPECNWSRLHILLYILFCQLLPILLADIRLAKGAVIVC